MGWCRRALTIAGMKVAGLDSHSFCRGCGGALFHGGAGRKAGSAASPQPALRMPDHAVTMAAAAPSRPAPAAAVASARTGPGLPVPPAGVTDAERRVPPPAAEAGARCAQRRRTPRRAARGREGGPCTESAGCAALPRSHAGCMSGRYCPLDFLIRYT